MGSAPAPDALAQGVLEGDRLLIARAISCVEDEAELAHALLSRLYPHSGRAHIVGVTGAPGTGKSTLVTALTKSYRAAGQTVAIVAVDPSSPFTGGALLGDRVRMRTLSGDAGVFIRSMATRGSLGGLSKTTGDAVTVLDAAGFERIFVETVGVGQAEVDIARTAHTTLVVEAPGMGDEVQAIKAGILEIADILVVNKADRPGVERTVAALEMALELERGPSRQIRHHGQLFRVESPPAASDQEPGWPVTVIKTIAANGAGVEELRQRIEAHRRWLHTSGELALREQVRIAHALEAIVRSELNRQIAARLSTVDRSALVQAVYQRQLDPYHAAETILQGLADSQQRKE
jgi:LAO/AO transport system kinase